VRPRGHFVTSVPQKLTTAGHATAFALRVDIPIQTFEAGRRS
jgi:hypothetical protein